MYKSNINVKSNIYIRSAEAVEQDAEFVARITDKSALEKLRDYTDKNMKELKLSEVQLQILDGKPCEHNSSGEITHGAVLENGVLVYQCRCEAKDCPNADKCGRVTLTRDLDDFGDGEDNSLANLGVDGNTDVFANPEGDEPPEDDYSEEDAQAVASLLADSGEYEEITAEDARARIIEADISARIIVNGAPGAGKTYTAAERLAYICKSAGADNFPNVLVLCRTDSAAEEINSRIDGDIAVPVTFDAFATGYLADKGISTAELCELTYDGRISLFNEKIDPVDFAGLEYCIIDELHELVNERAEMALNILKSLKCGFLLLEDKYQAVFDYSSDSGFTMDFAAFYGTLKETLPDDTKKFTLVGNKRQSENLERMTELLRSELLDDNREHIADVFKKQLSELPQTMLDEGFKVVPENGEGTAAILCRRNGDAEYISWLLHKNGVTHTLIRENAAGASLGRYLADILWDHREKTINRESFVKRFLARCDRDEGQANVFFDALCGYLGVSDNIDSEQLAEKLCRGGELPSQILNARSNMLTVSTIRKAKGREFDKVYLLGYDFTSDSSSNDEKLFYLAETRPKSELEILRRKSKWAFKRNKNNRWIRTVREAYKAQSVCVGFGTGDSEDLDYYSFVEGETADAVRRQAYISRNVKCGDEITLRLCGDVYEILHNDTVVGKMSRSYSENLLDDFNGKQYITELPEKISELFVTNVITFVSYKDLSGDESVNIPAQFRKKRFWLGVEISGFGVIDNQK